ncbi:hypothetical protein JCM11641_007774 [Rhodosporidiobolus odoratus]
MSRFFRDDRDPSSARPLSSLQSDAGDGHRRRDTPSTFGGPLGESTQGPDRAAILSSRLDYAGSVLRWATAEDDPYGAMVIRLYEKAITEIDETISLVERTRRAGQGVSRRQPFPTFSPPGSKACDRRNRERDLDIPSEHRSRNKEDPRFLEKLSTERDESALRHESASRFDERKEDRKDPSLPTFSVDKGRPRSAYGHREPSPPPPKEHGRSSSSRRAPIPPASPSPTSPDAPHKAPLPPSRPPSRPASRVESPALSQREEPAPPAPSSFSRLFKRRPDAASPPVVAEEKKPLSPPPREDEFRRPSSRLSEKSSASKGDPRPPSSSSRRHRHIPSASEEEEESFLPPPIQVQESGRSRARSFGGGPARSRSGRSEEAKRALDMASAPPPLSDDEDGRRGAFPPQSKHREPLRLDGDKIAKAMALAVATSPGGKETLLKLATVSKTYSNAANLVLYSTITITSLPQLERLNSTFDSHSSLGQLTTSLTILPLDKVSSAASPESIIPALAQLVSHVPNLTSFDEDFTTADWDVTSLLTGKEYPLTISPSAPKNLTRFRSAKCWFEIGALYQLLTSQPNLKELIIGGAAMDRDWEGAKLISALSSASAGPPPALRLESLEAAQVMHEDTLAVLLRACGGSSGALRSLRIGFQSIGSTDDDTPRASIPAALALVGSSLIHLAISAPSKASDDTTGLIDDALDVLPSLEILEFSEQTDLVPAPIGSSKTLTKLPKSLKTLRASSVVSISTGKVLTMLDDPEMIPGLREVDFVWAVGTGEEEGTEAWWKERHVGRIEEACEEIGIRCRVKKGDEALVFERSARFTPLGAALPSVAVVMEALQVSDEKYDPLGQANFSEVKPIGA